MSAAAQTKIATLAAIWSHFGIPSDGGAASRNTTSQQATQPIFMMDHKLRSVDSAMHLGYHDDVH